MAMLSESIYQSHKENRKKIIFWGQTLNGIVHMPLKIEFAKTHFPVLELISKELIEQLSVDRKRKRVF